MSGSNVFRLPKIQGFEERFNDILYLPPTTTPKTPRHSLVVYFGGDVQDYSENMKNHQGHVKYLQWNLESSATLLGNHFPQDHIVVIRPSRMESGTFSCYDNFVPSGMGGVPEHTPNHNALQHLGLLLQTVSDILSPPETECKVEDLEKEKGASLKDARLRLVGFSKGCVVLNQFLYEFHYLDNLFPRDESISGTVGRIEEMYWLDGGHSGGRNTWITSTNLLETLARIGVKIHVHVTPYQVNDERRPWIRKEERAFVETLQRLGAPIESSLHFQDQPPSLHSHFKLLNVFKQASA